MGLSDRYEIEDLVVQDESGVTFRARDRQNDQAVALRRFFPGSSSGSGLQGEEITAFAGMVEALKQLRHPSLCGVLDGGVDQVDGIPYLVTDWAEGKRLSEILEEGPLVPEQAVAVAGQAMEVLVVLREKFGEVAEWLEMEATSVLVNEENGVCSFTICPLQVLGVAPREGGVKGMGFLMDLAMGWEGHVIPKAAAGLGGWVRQAKEGSWSVDEAYNELVKIRSVWTGEVVPETPAAPKRQLQTTGAAGPAQAAAISAAHRIYRAPKKSKAGMAAGMVFFGVLVLGGGIWLGIAEPWAAAEVVGEGPKLVVLEPRSGGKASAKPLEKVAPKPAAKGEGSGKNGKKETAQERINRIARETTEKMGIDLERAKKDAVMPAVFGAGDGARIRSWMGETVTLEAKLFRARDSKSGKTRYLEFSEEIGADVIAVRCWPSDEFALEGLKALEGKKVRFKGRAEQERGTGRVVVHLETRSQIEEVESGPEAR